MSDIILHRLEFLVVIVSKNYSVSVEKIFEASRGQAHISFARKIIMALAHTSLSLSMAQVGKIFKRDRTTVSHACIWLEDERDDDIFDAQIKLIEIALDSFCNIIDESPMLEQSNV